MLILPKKLRKKLKKPFGKLYKSIDDIKNFPPNEYKIISVGDETTKNLVDRGIYPDVAIIDRKIQRKKSYYRIEYKSKILNVSNPPGTITESLMNAIKKALKSKEKTIINVSGEEDLAVLPAILFSSKALILYGQPNEGVVVVDADKSKNKAKKIIKEFKEVKEHGNKYN
ncbi:Protein of unknown function DUF359 [Methanothermus fervidus DSM 2088]|uniref:GTP-dependent dephospho-CoA kinase n=1 Tax=Methanothermus fervidus (strain ATCC 43054 / DSM 2088 / JCM 10308 / V24 S) TaxID=523846 RepID=E3GY58_METFV|nr:GTP-dependent dephospho-CoA kinase family protein [Methanothermus fervidus]ADP77240.1 Protein of unknown function DUF359 [Methanothermus fervidus DSM 2088]